MKKNNIDKLLAGEHLGCFGNFSLDDPICRNLCAINLRCAIESEQNTRLEILQDLVSSDDLYVKIQ
jgi:hypothetical protein